MVQRALLLVDLQNDFCPGGALAVPEGDRVIPRANNLMPKFELVLATQDWHPRGHKSFASTHQKKPGERIVLNGLEQILWPDHCVQHTRGADFAPGFRIGNVAKVFAKGTDPEIDSYSGFYDNAHRKATGLADYLRGKRVREVFIAGLATDYCVRYTALDAVALGFKAAVFEDACRGVELRPGDVKRAIQDMREAGVRILRSDSFPSAPEPS